MSNDKSAVAGFFVSFQKSIFAVILDRPILIIILVMKIIFLGTNGWCPTSTGQNLSILIDAAEGYFILDAGSGFFKARQYLTDPDKPVRMFLSHFHLDHIFGLHTLPAFNLKNGLTIYGQPGLEKNLSAAINHPFALPVAEMSFPVSLVELSAGPQTLSFLPATDYLVHADPCFGYRFFLEGKIISFCTDTGECDSLVKLSQAADLLICECSTKNTPDPAWPHLNPEMAATMAQKAGVKKLALVHFGADSFSTMTDRVTAEERAKKIFPQTIATHDDLIIEI